jgi:hypothetical protein
MENNNGSSDQTVFSYMSLIGAILASLCFFGPWIGCDRMTKSGADIGEEFWLVFGSSVIIIFVFFFFKSQKTLSKAKIIIAICSVFGIGFLLYKYIKIQNSEFAHSIEIKWGSIATFIGFVMSLIGVSFLKDEVKLDKVINPSKNKIAFCSKCGTQFNDNSGEYCENCGAPKE